VLSTENWRAFDFVHSHSAPCCVAGAGSLADQRLFDANHSWTAYGFPGEHGFSLREERQKWL